MMMKWNVLSSHCKPKKDECVLVSFVCSGKRFPDACCMAILGEDYEGNAAWDTGSQFYPVHNTDRWLYIDLPED